MDWNMEFLFILEKIRSPILNALFSFVTIFGEETFFIVIGILFFWCIDKKEGYYILSIGLMGTVINRFLKQLFCVPRPWIKDPSLTVVESAMAEATGFSFPSGHTQSSVGIFAAIARWNKPVLLRVVCIVLCILTPFSRLYLGVHTPTDVIASLLIALVLVLLFYPIMRKAYTSPRGTLILFAVMISLTIGAIVFTELYEFPSNVEVERLLDSEKNLYKMLGCISALWVSFIIDLKYISFETKAPFGAQVLKVILGLIPLMLIKTFLKEPLYHLIENESVADGIRYFLMTAFASVLWPMSFPFFTRLFARDKRSAPK